MEKLLIKTRGYVKRNASTILTVVGGAGVIGTAVLAAKGTVKALNVLEKAEQEKGEPLTEMEVLKTAAPAYVPAVITGTATLVCIFGAHTLSKRQQASLISAYVLLDNSYKEYKKKVEDMYGEGTNKQIRAEIVKDHYVKNDKKYDEDAMLFYDYFSERYFESTMDKVLYAENQINKHLVTRDWAYLNEFYEDLGLPPIREAEELGWSPGFNEQWSWSPWLDFSHEKAVMDDGLECIIIVMSVEPRGDFYDYV